MNALYGVNFRTKTVYLTNEARYWKTKAKLFIPNINLQEGTYLTVSVEVTAPWFFKNGKPKKADVQNLGKVILDAISERCGFDDCLIWNIGLRKVHSETKQQISVYIDRFKKEYTK